MVADAGAEVIVTPSPLYPLTDKQAKESTLRGLKRRLSESFVKKGFCKSNMCKTHVR